MWTFCLYKEDNLSEICRQYNCRVGCCRPSYWFLGGHHQENGRVTFFSFWKAMFLRGCRGKLGINYIMWIRFCSLIASRWGSNASRCLCLMGSELVILNVFLSQLAMEIWITTLVYTICIEYKQFWAVIILKIKPKNARAV